MNAAAPHSPAEAAATAAAVARALDAILADLLALLLRFASYTRLLGPLAIPVWNRISRTRLRLVRALAHIAAGRALRPRPKRATPSRPASLRPDPATRAPVRRHGWLGGLLDHHVRAHASQLQHLLHQPGVAEILAASPGAARTLRPLCRMLGADLPAPLRPPPRPPRPARRPTPAASARISSTTRSSQPTGTPDRPLQSYVAAAIRHWKRRGMRNA